MKEFTSLEETIFFWVRNDSYIINNLLYNNMDAVWECAENAINDNRGILKEYETGVRVAGSCFGDPLDYKIITSLKTRLFEGLDENAKKEAILVTAKNDIAIILDAMAPPDDKLLLYRTVWDEITAETGYCFNGILELKSILATSTTPYMEDVDYDFYRYEITVPKNGLVLELDQFEYRNEQGEVLLPPIKCRVTNIRSGEKDRCKGIIELEYVEVLSR